MILGLAWKSWAQCPTADKVLGTQQTGRLGIKINSQTATTKLVSGTATDIVKICKGNTLYVEDQSANNNPSLSGYYFEYNSQTFDLRTAEPAGKVTSNSHTYNTPGTYALILTGSSLNGGHYACQTIQVADTPKPTFTAKSCSNRQVTIEIPQDASKNPYDTFIINWGDGTSETLTKDKLPYTKTYTYPASTPNTVNIMVSGGYTGSTCANTSDPLNVNINTPATFTPSITQLELAADKKAVTIQFVGSTAFNQNIFQKEVNGSYQATGLGSGTGGAISLTVNQLDPAKQYCFQVRTEVPTGCGNSGISPEICTVPLAVVPSSQQMDVSWKAYPNASDFDSYTVYKDNKEVAVIKDIKKLSFTDPDVVCGTSYCYQVVTQVKGVESISDRICKEIDSNDKPESISDGYVTVSGQGTLVDWKIPGGGKSMTDRIRKAEANGNFQNIPANEVKKPFPDAAVEVNRLSYCYQVAYQSACRTNSDFSGSFCTIYAIQQGDRIQWTSASPFLDKLTGYQVQVVDAQGNVIQSQNVGMQTSVSVNSIGSIQSGYQYRIEALSENGNVSISNLISVTESVRIYVPQAFSPNGDSQHDIFLPKMLNVTQMKLVIFDRWGNSIFSSEDMNRGWDGYVNGNPAPVGSYSYRVDIRNDAGNSFTKRGVFQLIR